MRVKIAGFQSLHQCDMRVVQQETSQDTHRATAVSLSLGLGLSKKESWPSRTDNRASTTYLFVNYRNDRRVRCCHTLCIEGFCVPGTVPLTRISIRLNSSHRARFHGAAETCLRRRPPGRCARSNQRMHAPPASCSQVCRAPYVHSPPSAPQNPRRCAAATPPQRTFRRHPPCFIAHHSLAPWPPRGAAVPCYDSFFLLSKREGCGSTRARSSQ